MVNSEKLTTRKAQHNMRWTAPYARNTNNVNKTRALLHTTGGKDEPNIVFMRKSQWTLQYVTQNVETHK